MSEDQGPAARLINGYYDQQRIDAQVALGNHRKIIGGKWALLGRLQSGFLVAQGLRPEHTLLDIGCGAFRGGVHAVAYLQPGHYFGVDISQSLLDVGYAREITPLGLAPRLPRQNLACTGDFEFPWDVTFDYAIALSLFTHLPLNLIRACLARLAPRMEAGGRFFATYHPAPTGDPGQPHSNRGRMTYPDRDPYHHAFHDLTLAGEALPWRITPVPDEQWLHPRQKMALFERI